MKNQLVLLLYRPTPALLNKKAGRSRHVNHMPRDSHWQERLPPPQLCTGCWSTNKRQPHMKAMDKYKRKGTLEMGRNETNEQ